MTEWQKGYTTGWISAVTGVIAGILLGQIL